MLREFPLCRFTNRFVWDQPCSLVLFFPHEFSPSLFRDLFVRGVQGNIFDSSFIWAQSELPAPNTGTLGFGRCGLSYSL
jgi:hypothetical protein